jgi:hypothetical protein
MRAFLTGSMAVLLAGCASTPSTPTLDDVPPVAFECRKRVEGKRSTGWQTVRFEPTRKDATLTLRFDGDAPACSFTASWNFPRSLAGYAGMIHDGTRQCRGSWQSPFAVSCDLMVPSFDTHAQSMRSELVVRTSGTLSRREVDFEVLAPSATVMPPPAPECQGLPITIAFGGLASVPVLQGERFLESDCAVLPAAAPK